MYEDKNNLIECGLKTWYLEFQVTLQSNIISELSLEIFEAKSTCIRL